MHHGCSRLRMIQMTYQSTCVPGPVNWKRIPREIFSTKSFRKMKWIGLLFDVWWFDVSRICYEMLMLARSASLMIVIKFLSNGGKTVKHDSSIRALLIVKPWNPWLRSFRTIWDAIEERRRVVRGNVTQSLITSTSTAIPIYLSLGRNIFHYHSSRYHSSGPVEGLAHYVIRGSIYYAFTWFLWWTHI